MRKDVKFGLTIGGVLVLVLIIWVSVVNRGNGTKKNDVALDDTPGDTATVNDSNTQTPAPPAVGHPNDVRAPDPARPSGGDPAVKPGPAAADWNKLLATGGGATLGSPVSMTIGDLSSGTHGDPLGNTGGATTRPSLATGRTHTVASGDTFSTIAAQYYGSSKYWKRIADANPHAESNRLHIGQILTIPEFHNAPTDSAIPVAAVTPTGGAPVADLDPAKSYRVQPEDTLIRIARKLYGRGQDWERIYDANKDAIGPNPARLKVGMILRLPEAPATPVAPTAATY